ncbi:MAG: hypothetical protein WD751_09505 [Anaerolineales bacterium]
MAKMDAKITDWLMAGDPAIRWQVQRDLLGAKPSLYEKERARVATEGWGARYLSHQDKAGTWAKALYSPKWTSTHYTMLALRFLGLAPGHPRALKAAKVLLDNGFREDRGIRYVNPADAKYPHGETCITGMALAILSYFQIEDGRVDLIAQHLLGEQMSDAGWNCRYRRGDTHASFNTTLLVLDGLRQYQQFRPKSKLPINEALANGREFLLRHRLYRSHRKGTIVRSNYLVAPSQPSWQYDFLRALDHFRAVGAPKDKRLQEPIDLLLSKRGADGRWDENRPASGQRWFTMEAAGKPGRWNTLRALRVLNWWEGRN